MNLDELLDSYNPIDVKYKKLFQDTTTFDESDINKINKEITFKFDLNNK